MRAVNPEKTVAENAVLLLDVVRAREPHNTAALGETTKNLLLNPTRALCPGGTEPDALATRLTAMAWAILCLHGTPRM